MAEDRLQVTSAARDRESNNDNYVPCRPTNSRPSLRRCSQLTAKYVEVRDKLREDKHAVLVGLIRAKAKASAEEVGRILTFFPTFEEKLRQKLVPVVMRLYRDDDWQRTIDDLKAKEGIETKTREKLSLGDLCQDLQENGSREADD